MSKFFRGLRLKLIVLSGVPMLCLLGLGSLAFFESSATSDAVSLVVVRNIPQLVSSYEILDNVTNIARGMNGMFMKWDDPAGQEKYKKRVDENIAELRTEVETLGKVPMNDVVRKNYDTLVATLDPYLNAVDEFTKKMLKKDLKKEDVTQLEAAFEHSDFTTKKEALTKATQEMLDTAKRLTGERTTSAVSQIDRMKAILLYGIIASLLFSIALVTFFTRLVTKGLDEVRADLSASGEQVAAASTQLSTASQQLSSGASTSAASLEESVASIQELTSMVKQNAENAQQASLISRKGREQADTGAKEMASLKESMSAIHQSSKKVEEIITVIDDIAFQTNLLALNAAVEAARAGEQGKGFAVVAEAVRTLAQKSATSAKEISDLIKQSGEQVQNGVSITEKSNVVLQDLVESIKKISDLNEEIATASSEQSKGLDQMSMAFNQLDQGVQGNASTSEEVAASAEELSAQALTMRSSIAQLAQLVDGIADASAPVSAPAPAAAAKPAPSKKPALSLVKKTPAAKPAPQKAAAPSPAGTHPTTDDEFWKDMPKMKRSA